MALVPNRACDACTACCVAPAIDTAELQKTSGEACRFLAAGCGCSIHPARPQVCRDWFCGWRQLPRLDAGWRPDLSGVLILLGAHEIPPDLAPYQATTFVITDPATWRPTPAFVAYLAALVEARAAVYLAAAGPLGRHPVQKLVNRSLSALVARRDDAALARGVAGIVADLAQGPFEPVVLSHASPARAGGGG